MHGFVTQVASCRNLRAIFAGWREVTSSEKARNSTLKRLAFRALAVNLSRETYIRKMGHAASLFSQNSNTLLKQACFGAIKQHKEDSKLGIMS